MFGKLKRAWQRLADVRQKNGPRAAAALIIDRIAQRLMTFEVVHVVWLELDRMRPELNPDPEFTFRFLTPEEVLTYSDDPANQLDPLFADRAADGHDLCFAALSGERLAAYGWYALESIEEGPCCNVDISYPADVAYMYNGFTSPDFRGKRLHGLAMGLALRALADQYGVTRLVSTVNWTNWASLKSCFRLGYEDVGRMVTIGLRRCLWRRFPREAQLRGVRFGKQAVSRPAKRQQSAELIGA
jgi:RimJ/RimL family protein N-acetyltransferase